MPAALHLADGDGAHEPSRGSPPSRRTLLATLVSALAASMVPGAGAATSASARDTFLALSAIIAGPRAKDGALARRLLDALQADDPSFPTLARALLRLVEEQHLASSGLQKVLDAGHPELAALPRQIASAWFMGIVGKDDKARCVAYESALGSVIVADILRPPTYAYGPYASWAAKPG